MQFQRHLEVLVLSGCSCWEQFDHLFVLLMNRRALGMATEAKYGPYSSTEWKNLENRYQLELTHIPTRFSCLDLGFSV